MNICAYFLRISQIIYFYFQTYLSYFKCKKPIISKYKNNMDELIDNTTDESLFELLNEQQKNSTINFYCYTCSEDCMKNQIFVMHDKIFCSYICRNYYQKQFEKLLVNNK